MHSDYDFSCIHLCTYGMALSYHLTFIQCILFDGYDNKSKAQHVFCCWHGNLIAVPGFAAPSFCFQPNRSIFQIE